MENEFIFRYLYIYDNSFGFAVVGMAKAYQQRKAVSRW
jgi:hypothetical protein